ncbi:MAG: DUF86 domain-containing protein [Thermomicrobiales bacterium]
MPPDVRGTLEDILEAIGFIETDTVGLSFEEFLADRKTRQAVVYNFEVIGEAVNRLRRHAPEIAERISNANKAVGLRNVLIHGYDRIEYTALWQTTHEFIPVLRAEVEGLLREQDGYSAG